MNTMSFIFGQLLTLEMLAAGGQTPRQRQHNRRQHRFRSSHLRKGVGMDNNILVIAFLIVTLIANFAMPTRNE